jgi:methylisocitrate lyase
VAQKRCGHRPNKSIVPLTEMVDRVKAAVDARSDDEFVIMARTDALAVEGMDAAIERAVACVEAGADAIFPEAMLELSQYRQFVDAVNVPVLANITEFGKTPLFNCKELGDHGVAMVLYPLSAFRAMSKAALEVYETIAINGDQTAMVDRMQTRDQLYEVLGYHVYEQKLDNLFAE